MTIAFVGLSFFLIAVLSAIALLLVICWPKCNVKDAQSRRISDYIRWGLTPEQAESWVVSGIYPNYSDMKKVRSNRWYEKENRAPNPPKETWPPSNKWNTFVELSGEEYLRTGLRYIAISSDGKETYTSIDGVQWRCRKNDEN